VTYSYAAVDRLREPCTYMYTPFEGADFVRAYHQSRAEVLDRIARTLDGQPHAGVVAAAGTLAASLATAGVFEGAARRLVESLPATPVVPAGRAPLLPTRQAAVETVEFLDAMVVTLGGGSAELGSEPRYWLDRLVARFELTRRVYQRYDAKLRGGAGAPDNLALYAKCGLIFALGEQRLGGLKLANVLLKIGDVLASTAPRLAQAGNEPLTAAFLALGREKLALLRWMKLLPSGSACH
jgi:hypothetical protein